MFVACNNDFKPSKVIPAFIIIDKSYIPAFSYNLDKATLHLNTLGVTSARKPAPSRLSIV